MTKDFCDRCGELTPRGKQYLGYPVRVDGPDPFRCVMDITFRNLGGGSGSAYLCIGCVKELARRGVEDFLKKDM